MQTPAIFRALELFSKGKSVLYVFEIIADEYEEMNEDQIRELVLSANEQFKEGQIPLENTEN